MAFRFESGEIVVSGKNADSMAGLAFVGMAAIGVVSFQLGKYIGDALGTMIWNTYQKRKEALKK